MSGPWAIAVMAAALAAGPQVRIDRVALVVDRDVLTDSELLAEARVALALREGERAARAELDAELLEGLRDYVIGQTLVAAQGRRAGVDEVSDEAVARRSWALRQRFSSNVAYVAFLQQFGIAEGAVTDILRRDLQNERTVEQHLRARSSQGRAAQDSKALVAAWLQQLREAAEVRLPGPSGELEAPLTGRSRLR